MFAIKEQLIAGTRIALLSGSLNADTVKTFAEWCNSCDTGTIQRIIFDFSELTYLSSAGLRAILTANRHAEKNGTTLLFCGLGGMVGEVFKTAGLLPYLRVFPGVNEALASP